MQRNHTTTRESGEMAIWQKTKHVFLDLLFLGRAIGVNARVELAVARVTETWEDDTGLILQNRTIRWCVRGSTLSMTALISTYLRQGVVDRAENNFNIRVLGEQILQT